MAGERMGCKIVPNKQYLAFGVSFAALLVGVAYGTPQHLIDINNHPSGITPTEQTYIINWTNAKGSVPSSAMVDQTNGACQLCHYDTRPFANLTAHPPNDLNSFGNAYSSNGDALSSAMLALDSDGGGESNVSEIKNLRYPGEITGGSNDDVTISITTTSLAALVVGTPFNQTLSATGSNIGSKSFTVTAGTLPAGLSLGASTGTISGTPTASGAYSFSIAVSTNGVTSAPQAYSGTITAQLVITTTSLPAPVVGVPYRQTIATMGATGALTFSISAGALPAGLSLNSATGEISGTPTAAGAYSFTVQATAGGITATQAYSGTVLSARSSADFNGDGLSDLIWRNTNGDAGIWLTTSGGSYMPVDFGVVDNSWTIQAAGDFNGDGKADLLWRNTNGALGEWLSKPGSGFTGFTTPTLAVVDPSWRIQGVGDFNGDGLTDLLWRNTNGDAGIWLTTAGGGFTTVDFGVIGLDWTIQGTGDFNGDGKADLVWRNANGAVGEWLSKPGSGFTGFTTPTLAVVDTSWRIQDVGDFNGDGLSDLLWRNINGDTGIWLTTAGGGYTAVDFGVIGLGWTIQGVSDFNGDGKADILWRNTNGAVAEWLSKPGAGFTGFNYVILANVDPSWRLQGIPPALRGNLVGMLATSTAAMSARTSAARAASTTSAASLHSFPGCVVPAPVAAPDRLNVTQMYRNAAVCRGGAIHYKITPFGQPGPAPSSR
jgi:hypothetical protein